MYGRGNRHPDIISDDNSADLINTLICGQGDWKLSKVSALYNLEYGVARLKQYASKIKHSLNSIVTEKRSIEYRVSVEAVPELRKYEGDPCALSINVHTITVSEGAEEVLSYSAILMSWGVFAAVPCGTHLPYLLERGRQPIADSVKMTLTKLFDCCIAPIYLNKGHMMLLAIDFCQVESDDSKGLKFVYKIPDVPRGKITLTIDVRSIYDSVAANDEEEVSHEQLAEMTYVGLQRHVFLTVAMDVSPLELSKVAHPSASVNNVGTIRFKSTLIARSAFEVFNKLLLTD